MADTRAGFAARSCFNGWLVCTAWPRDVVAGCLPAELALAPVPPEANLHPVIFFFGEQTATSLLFGGLVIPTGTSFREFGMAVPFVQRRQGGDLHIYVPGLYAAYFPTVWVGTEHYGYAKMLAHCSWYGDVFVVTAPEGQLVAQAAVEAAGAWTTALAAGIPALDAVRSLFTTLPVLGRRARGDFVISRFAWDLGDASARPGDARISLAAPTLPSVPARECVDLPGGSVEVRGIVWDLGWPAPWTTRFG